MTNLIQTLISGLSLGSIYALIALGYTMVYGIAKMLNFAHGDVIMVGAYSGIVAVAQMGLSPWVTVIVSIAVCAVLGVVIEFCAYKPLRQAAPLSVLITAIGVSYLLQNAALLIFGSQQMAYPTLVKLPGFTVGGVHVDGITVLTLAVTAALMIALTLFIDKTKLGKAMRAVSEDKNAATLMGISVDRTITLTFAIGSALANTALPLAVRLPVSMLAGGLVAAVFGLLVGLPALRLRGDYLAIVTLACGEIIKNVITNLNFTGGALGLNTTAIYAGAKELLPYGAVLVLLTVAVMLNLKRSKYGRAIMAIRDNRIAAESVGLNVTWYKLAVFVIAAFFAGCAGVLYGHSLANIKAAAFDYNMSIEILVIVVLGGMGSVPGSIVSAIVLTVLPEALREVADYRMLVYAIVLILVMQATNNPTMKRFFGSVREKLTPKRKERAAL